MKAYKVVLLIVDHDGVGDRISETIENQKFPNRCISPHVMSIESADIGLWDDDHPLNNTSKQKAEFERLFYEHQASKSSRPYGPDV